MASTQQMEQTFSTMEEAASLFSAVSAELVMFVVAAAVYLLVVRGVKLPGKQAKRTKQSPSPPTSGVCRSAGDPVERAPSATGARPVRGAAGPRSTKATGATSGDRAVESAVRELAHAGGDITQKAALIKAHAREHNFEGAKAVFRQFHGANSMLSNSFLDACVQCGDFKAALAHFGEMKRLGLTDIVSYNTMLKAYLKRGQVAEAQVLLKEMSARGLQASKVTYHELLNAMVTNRDKKGAWRLLDEMKEAGVTANPVTCSILLKSLTDRSSPSEIERTMSLVEHIEEPVDEVLFSSVIEACIRIRQLHFLSDMMKRYRTNGGYVALTAPTYGSMIKAFGQAGNVAQVWELWHEMEARAVQPTPITLGCMTEALVRSGRTQDAWDLIHKQQLRGEQSNGVNTVIYSTVVKGFAAAKSLDKAFAVYEEMRRKEIPCNTITYNTMLDACAKCCAMGRASELLADMKAASVEPDVITYSTVVKGHCFEGDIDKAFAVLKEMKVEKKLEPDEIMYNSFLDGCAKQHRTDEALSALEMMQAAGVSPSNYTVSILVKLLGRAKRLNQAFDVMEDLSARHSFRPNVQVYTCLMQACILNRKLDRALTLHDTMVSEGRVTPDEKLYTGLVRGCLQLHAPQKAAEVVRAAYQLPCSAVVSSPKKGLAPAGVEMYVMVETCASLRGGSKENQAIADALTADMQELRGISIDLHRANGPAGAWRRGGAGQR